MRRRVLRRLAAVRLRARRAPWLTPALDVLLAVAVCVLSMLPLTVDDPGCECVVTPWAYVAAAGQTLPLVARRRAPLAVNLVIAPSAIIFGFVGWPSPLVPIGPLVALHAIAAYGRWWQAIVAVTVAVAAVPVTILARPLESDPYEWLNLLLAVFVAWLAGALTRSRRGAAEQARQRAAAERAGRRAEEARAVAEERNRIGREMHDLLGHSVGVMVVLAEGGAAAVVERPAAGVQAFELIARTGRETMTDLRRMLAVVHAGDAGDGAREPLPTSAGIAGLVDTLRAAGVAVTLRMPQGPALTGVAGVTVYRVVQEALTNALKHAPGEAVHVDVTQTAERFAVEVRNRVPAGAGPPVPGHGLRGMRERADSIGADLRCGVEAGTFAVTLHLTRSATSDARG